MNIDYTIITTKSEIETIDKEKYNFIKSNAEVVAEAFNKISAANKPEWNAQHGRCKHVSKEVYAKELVFLKDYKNEDFTTKTLLTSKIIYPNTEMIISILLLKNITYEKLERTISKIEKIKQMAILNSQILDDNTTITDKNLNYLCLILSKYYPYENRNYMITRLVDIVVNEKELYLSLQGETKEQNKAR